MCGRFEIFESARHFRIEFESGHPIRILIESQSFADRDFDTFTPKFNRFFLSRSTRRLLQSCLEAVAMTPTVGFCFNRHNFLDIIPS